MVRFISDDLQTFKFAEEGTGYLLTNTWFKKNKMLCLQKQTVILKNYCPALQKFGTVNSRMFLVNTSDFCD